MKSKVTTERSNTDIKLEVCTELAFSFAPPPLQTRADELGALVTLQHPSG